MSVSASAQQKAFPDFDIDGDVSPSATTPSSSQPTPRSPAFPDLDDDYVHLTSPAAKPALAGRSTRSTPRISLEDGLADVSRSSGSYRLKNVGPAAPPPGSAQHPANHLASNPGDLRPVLEMDMDTTSSDTDSDEHAILNMLKPAGSQRTLESQRGVLHGSLFDVANKATGRSKERRRSLGEGRPSSSSGVVRVGGSDAVASRHVELYEPHGNARDPRTSNLMKSGDSLEKSDSGREKSGGDGLLRRLTAGPKKIGGTKLASWFGGLGGSKKDKDGSVKDKDRHERDIASPAGSRRSAESDAMSAGAHIPVSLSSGGASGSISSHGSVKRVSPRPAAAHESNAAAGNQHPLRIPQSSTEPDLQAAADALAVASRLANQHARHLPHSHMNEHSDASSHSAAPGGIRARQAALHKAAAAAIAASPAGSTSSPASDSPRMSAPATPASPPSSSPSHRPPVSSSNRSLKEQQLVSREVSPDDKHRPISLSGGNTSDHSLPSPWGSTTVTSSSHESAGNHRSTMRDGKRISPSAMFPKSSSYTSMFASKDAGTNSPDISPTSPFIPKSSSHLSPANDLKGGAFLQSLISGKGGSPMGSGGGNRRTSMSGEISLGDMSVSGMEMWQQLGHGRRNRAQPGAQSALGSGPGSVGLTASPGGATAAMLHRRSIDQKPAELPSLKISMHKVADGFPDHGREALSVKEKKACPWEGAIASPKHKSPSPPSTHDRQGGRSAGAGGGATPPSPFNARLAAVKDTGSQDFIRMSFGDEFQPGWMANRSVWMSGEASGSMKTPQERERLKGGGRLALHHKSPDLFESAQAALTTSSKDIYFDSPQAMKPAVSRHAALGSSHEHSPLGSPIGGRDSDELPSQSGSSSPVIGWKPRKEPGRVSPPPLIAGRAHEEHSSHHHRRSRSPMSDRAASPVNSRPTSPLSSARRHAAPSSHCYPHSTTTSPTRAFDSGTDNGYDLSARQPGRRAGRRSSVEIRAGPQTDSSDVASAADTDVESGEERRRSKQHGEEKEHHHRVRGSRRLAVNSDRAAGSGGKAGAPSVQVRQAGRQRQARADDTVQRQLVANYEVDNLTSEQLAKLLANPVPVSSHRRRRMRKAPSRLSEASGLSEDSEGCPPPVIGESKKTTSIRRAANTFESLFSAAKKAPGRLMGKGPRDHVLQQAYEDVAGKFALSKDELGSGQYGVIRRCMEVETGKIFACKTIKKQSIRHFSEAEDIRKEVACLKMLQPHPYIVELKATFEDEKDVHIVMELCRGGDLFDRLVARGSLSEPNGARLCKALIEALLHCHTHRCVHRDIKPENILLVDKISDTKIKLVDFGVATFYQRGKKITDIMGTPEYMAPEQIMGCYGPEADIWSAGVVMYVVMCGLPPFWASDRDGVKRAIVQKEVSFKSPKWSGTSEECKDLIARMLVKNPADRILANSVLEHPWILKWCTSR